MMELFGVVEFQEMYYLDIRTTQGFDGNTSTFVYADNSSTMTWTAPKKIEGQLIEIYAYAGNTHPILKVNGKSTGAVVGGTAQQNVWVDVTHLCPGGNLETIQAFGQNIGGVDRSSVGLQFVLMVLLLLIAPQQILLLAPTVSIFRWIMKMTLK